MQFMIQVFRERQYSAAKASDFLCNYPNPGAAGIDGKVVEASVVRSGPFTGRSVRIEGLARQTPLVQLARAFVTDGKLYVLTANSEQNRLDTRMAEKFFNSFELKR